MKKTSISTDDSGNKLGYLDTYEEIIKYKKVSNLWAVPVVGKNAMDREVILSRGVRWLLFGTFILLQLLMNMDHGTFPAATTDIKNDLYIDDDVLGIFGSL